MVVYTHEEFMAFITQKNKPKKEEFKKNKKEKKPWDKKTQ